MRFLERLREEADLPKSRRRHDGAAHRVHVRLPDVQGISHLAGGFRQIARHYRHQGTCTTRIPCARSTLNSRVRSIRLASIRVSRLSGTHSENLISDRIFLDKGMSKTVEASETSRSMSDRIDPTSAFPFTVTEKWSPDP